MGTVPFSTWRLVSRTTDRTVVARLAIADRFWPRLLGLQFRRPLPPEAGLLLVPCGSVHTCFLRFALDVAFLDDRGTVLAVRRNLRPWRVAAGPRGSHAVLEVATGSVEPTVGDTLRLVASDGDGQSPPPLKGFLRE